MVASPTIIPNKNCSTGHHAENLYPNSFFLPCSYLPLTFPFYATFHAIDLSLRFKVQLKVKVDFIVSQDQFEEMLKQFESNILILLYSENSSVKGNNSCLTDCIVTFMSQFDSN